jgi:hypothetical protein
MTVFTESVVACSLGRRITLVPAPGPGYGPIAWPAEPHPRLLNVLSKNTQRK